MEFVVGTAELADVFGVSQRQIQNLVAAGVITNAGSAKAYRFDLREVVPQYAAYLMSGESLASWCGDV